MEEKVHLLAARFHFEIAEEKNKEYDAETDPDKRTALRIVAAQNYFYAIVNWIETVLAQKGEHSFSHENRMSRVLEKRMLFGEEIFQLFKKVERDQRNKVAYRGENGPLYENIVTLANFLKEKYG